MELTDKQKAAIDFFQLRHKRNWKVELSSCWMKSSYPGVPEDHAAALQSIRNQFGPAWLNKQKK